MPDQPEARLPFAIAGWFIALQRCVRAVDYEAALPLFDDDVVSFGTHAQLVRGLGALRANQWQNVWPNIEGFHFDLNQLHGAAADGVAWAAAPWTSTGFGPDGAPFPRPGRATIGFALRDTGWVATHSHFSLDPGTPPRTYGRRGAP